jgi:hypothetical protein
VYLKLFDRRMETHTGNLYILIYLCNYYVVYDAFSVVETHIFSQKYGFSMDRVVNCLQKFC